MASRRCARCPNHVAGNDQICEPCREKARRCEDCGEPHGGSPGTTTLCPPCRAKRRAKPRHPKNPPWTAREDALIREAYAACNHREIGPRLRQLFPGRPRWSITRRAQVLGACTVRVKEARWSPEEDALLKQVGWMSPERIVVKFREAGFKRTLTAIAVRMKRFEVRRGIDSLTANGLAKLLDVDLHAVTRWIDAGWLAAERHGTTGDNHDHFHITTGAVRAFIFVHPECIVLSKLERAGSKGWFLDLLTGGAIGEGSGPSTAPAPATSAERTFALYGERVTASALSEICGRSVADLLHRIDGLGCSVEQAAFGEGEGESTEPTNLARGLAKQLVAQMKRHRAKAADLVTWLDVPAGVVERLTTGAMPLVSPLLVRAVEILDGELEVAIRPKLHGGR